MMKKFVILSIVPLAVIVGAVMFRPLPLENVILENAKILILITDLSIENGVPKMNTSQHVLRLGTEEHARILQVLSQYSYRRTFRTFFGDGTLSGNDAGYWLAFYSNEGSILLSTGGTGEIRVKSNVYRIGFRGNRRALEMMSEIRGVLENACHPEQGEGSFSRIMEHPARTAAFLA